MTVGLKKALILNLPYLLFVYLFDKLCQAVRLAPGLDASEKFLHLSQGFTEAFSYAAPSLHPLDLLAGIAEVGIVRLAVYAKSKNTKKYRKGVEYGSARWGTAADIAPYVDPIPDWNIPLTQTEKLTMSSRPKNPKYAQNKNILVIGGSGSGKTRFFVKPSLMQMHSSYVVTDPNGRIIRQGNRNKEVKVFNYVTEGTFDAYLWQTLENKQRFISQIMTSKSPVRSCDDVDEQALSYAEVKALCAGNPLIKEKMDLDVQVAKLKVLKADHQSQKYRLEDKLLTQFPADIQQQRTHISALKTDAETAAVHPQDKENFCGMTIKGMMFDDKKTAGERLILAAKELPDTEPVVLGEYRGFELSVRYEPVRNEQQAVLKGKAIYPVALGADPHGNITRLDNLLAGFDERIANAENRLENLLQQQTAAQAEVEKPFPQEEELAQKSARLAELNAQLDVDEKHHEPEMEETPDEESARPSVLAALNEKSDKEEPVKPFRSYSDRDGDAR